MAAGDLTAPNFDFGGSRYGFGPLTKPATGMEAWKCWEFDHEGRHFYFYHTHELTDAERQKVRSDPSVTRGH